MKPYCVVHLSCSVASCNCVISFWLVANFDGEKVVGQRETKCMLLNIKTSVMHSQRLSDLLRVDLIKKSQNGTFLNMKV